MLSASNIHFVQLSFRLTFVPNFVNIILVCLFFFYNSSILYLEGSLETKIFTDPATGLVRRVREVAIRRNGTFMNFFSPISLLKFLNN